MPIRRTCPTADARPTISSPCYKNNLAWLDERGVEAIVMACNTSCAIADVYGWPTTRAEVFDLLDSATIALQRSGARRIGIVATEATVRSGAYGRRDSQCDSRK